MAYRVKKAFLQHPQLTTVIDGKRVALIEAYTHTTAATVESPSKTISVPKATQAELKIIFERGDPCIEQYDDSGEAKKTDIFEHKISPNPFPGVTEELLEEHGLKAKDQKPKTKDKKE